MRVTAECVSPRHPDKLCDRIADSILTELTRQDPRTRAAIEVMGGHGILNVTGEVTSDGYVNIPLLVHEILGNQIGVQTNLVRQSSEIAQGVDPGGAGDQGIMVGYATAETMNMLPPEQALAHEICAQLYEAIEKDDEGGSFEDGKVQVTLVADDFGGRKRIEKIVASFANIPGHAISRILDQILIKFFNDPKAAQKWHIDPGQTTPPMYVINPAGDWEISGFDADTGLTGRKLICDSYGPQIPIGGGAFSGKDPTKVDRSAALMARKMAKDFVRAGAREAIVKVAYAIGQADPVMATVQRDGAIAEDIDEKKFQLLRPQAIIEELGLLTIDWEAMAQYGPFHFYNAPWEL